MNQKGLHMGQSEREGCRFFIFLLEEVLAGVLHLLGWNLLVKREIFYSYSEWAERLSFSKMILGNGTMKCLVIFVLGFIFFLMILRNLMREMVKVPLIWKIGHVGGLEKRSRMIID